jgi:hypothetical protein
MASFQSRILRHRLMVPDSDASRFGLGFFKGKISAFNDLYLCKELLITVPPDGLGEGRRGFCNAAL